MNSDSSVLEFVAEKHALPALQSRSRETRARILAAAEKEFADKGFAGATLADIAQRAGCSVGTVYFRFKDKNALFLAIVEAFVEESRGGIVAITRSANRLDPDYVVRQFVTTTAWNYRRHKGLFRAIVKRGLDEDHALRSMFRLRDEFAQALEIMLKPLGVKNLSLKVRVMTQMVYGFLLTGVINPQAPTNVADARALAELADACIAYLHGEPE